MCIVAGCCSSPAAVVEAVVTRCTVADSLCQKIIAKTETSCSVGEYLSPDMKSQGKETAKARAVRHMGMSRQALWCQLIPCCCGG